MTIVHFQDSESLSVLEAEVIDPSKQFQEIPKLYYLDEVGIWKPPFRRLQGH